MLKCPFILATLLVVAFCGGCSKTETALTPASAKDERNNRFEPSQAQPKLRTVKLWLGPEELVAEVPSPRNRSQPA
jgi:hypothetical protein